MENFTNEEATAVIPARTPIPGTYGQPEGYSVAIVDVPVTVLGYTNRGMNGIDARVELPDGRRVGILAERLRWTF